MTEQSPGGATFEQYPSAPRSSPDQADTPLEAFETAADLEPWTVLVIRETQGQANVWEPSAAHGPMPRERALELLQQVVDRYEGAIVVPHEQDIIMRPGPNEVILYRDSGWTGLHLTRVVAGPGQ